MKKISIVLLAVFYIGIANVNAQTEVNDKKATVVYSEGDQEIIMVEKVKTCAKTGKVCDATCENKKNGTCCKGEKNKSCSKSEKVSCSKSKAKCSKSEKASCSKDEKKVSCSKSNNKKGCCKKEATAMSIK
tara:strand:+ start:154 stop:546 length:393 start_codon:yes stop_codon:yes gene_type:complete